MQLGKFKSVLGLGLSLTVVSALSGCGSQVTSNKPVTITVWTYGNFLAASAIEKKFNSTHNAIKLVFSPIPLPPGDSSYAFTTGKLIASELAGTAPNIVLNDQVTTAGWASQGLLVPLTKYLGKMGIEKQNFPTGAWDSVVYKNQVYGAPVNWDPDNMLYYNIDLMKKAGISSPPKTFEELWSDAKKLTKKTHGKYTQMGFIPWEGYTFNIFGWAHMYGGTPISSSGKITLNSPAMIKSATWEQKWAKAYGPNAIGDFISSTPSGMDPFVTGQLAFMVTGDWELPSLQKYAPNFKYGKDWGVTTAPIPQGGEPNYLASGWSWVVPKNSPNLKQTLQVIQWLSQPKITEQWCVATGWIPASIPILKQSISSIEKNDPGYTPFINEEIKHPNLLPELPAADNDQAVITEGTDAENKIYHLTQSPRQALNSAQTRAQAGM